MATTTTTIGPEVPWGDRVATVRAWCELDHEVGDQPRPRLLGYLDDRLAIAIDLRPFPPGGMHRPLTEAMAALAGVGCTGIVAAFPGRAWSMQDPIPPVTEGVDLRQRVVVVTSARRGDRPACVVLPFEADADGLRWLSVLAMPGPDERIGRMLEVTVMHEFDATVEEASRQLARCVALGHTVAMAGAGAGGARA